MYFLSLSIASLIIIRPFIVLRNEQIIPVAHSYICTF